MAKLGAVIDQWMEQTQVAISAAQCWTSLEEYSGVVPCTVMSMMSENLISSACDVDICGVVGEGEFTDDPLDTFGGAGVVRIPKLQELLRYICERGFEHHVAANLASVGAAVREATTRYLGWKVHQHSDGKSEVHV
jgi:L-fucose isomerase-like protein